ncbi:GNAT family N-acetyltransferase [Bacillota bacterium Meth-B3]
MPRLYEGPALAYLEQNPLHHMDMLQTIRRGSAEVLAADAHGVLLLEKESGAHMLTVEAPRYAAEFLAQIEAARLMTVHQEYLLEDAAHRFGLRPILRCHQAAWLHPAPPAVPQTPFRIEALTPDMLDDVQALYSHDIGAAYIKGRLLAGEMFGAFGDGALAGFIGLHEEGSMGMLEVLPAFRRMGVATGLIAHLCALLMDRGLTPFSQFTVENTASRKLHEAMGFSISSDTVCWLEPAEA